MLAFTEYKDRSEWLAGRQKTIGASEVAAAMGESSFMTPGQLWDLKVNGNDEGAEDKAANELIAYGTAAEEHLRALFALKHKNEFSVDYHPFRVYTNDDCPHLSCTLDGELTGIGGIYDGRKGIWECKTALIMSRRSASEWEGDSIPQKYYLQVLAQFLVTGYDFAILNAELRYPDGGANIREYSINRAEVTDDMEYVAAETAKFFETVKSKKKPKPVLTI